MVQILSFKKGATIIKLNAAATNLNFRGILMSNCGREWHTVAYLVQALFYKPEGHGFVSQ
jgi:hypothetical protein